MNQFKQFHSSFVKSVLFNDKLQTGENWTLPIILQVKKSDILLILESMKMENPIIAHKSGVIRNIFVSNGVSVKSGDTLLVLE